MFLQFQRQKQMIGNLTFNSFESYGGQFWHWVMRTYMHVRQLKNVKTHTHVQHYSYKCKQTSFLVACTKNAQQLHDFHHALQFEIGEPNFEI